MGTRKILVFPLLIFILLMPLTASAGFLGDLWDGITGGNIGKNAGVEAAKQLDKTLEKAIEKAGPEMRETLITTREELQKIISQAGDLYDDKLKNTANTIDSLTTKKLNELEKLMVKANSLLQSDIKLTGEETRKTIQELNDLANNVSKRIENIIVVGGETTVYVIDRSTNNILVFFSLAMLGIGILVFFKSFFSKKIPQGVSTYVVFLLMFVYFGLFSTMLVSPYARAAAMSYTGVGLKSRIEKADNPTSTQPQEPSQPKRFSSDFSNFPTGKFIKENHLDSFGIALVKAAPEGSYCTDAKPAILAPGRYRYNKSFLSTASNNNLKSCNGVPLYFELKNPAKVVTIKFYGANTPYQLTGYRNDGSIIEVAKSNARPYDYSSTFTIKIKSSKSNIAAFKFGKSTALTIIDSIDYEF